MKDYPPIYTQLEKPPECPRWPKASEQVTDYELAALLARWRFERMKFPGWVVTPDEKRRSAWFSTKHWSDPIMKHVNSWSAVDRLLIYRELNWRLEISMVPLFTNWIVPFKQAISDSFDDLVAAKPLSPSSWFTGLDGTKEQETLRSWLEIAFALLREARETYNASYWSELQQRLAKLVERDRQFLDRWHYENALWAIWNIERERAKSLLADWQPTPTRPLASIWKAGLLAELGEIDEPRDLLHQTLKEIRNAENVNGQDISLFSQEGWCMYLLSAIERSQNFGARPAREFLERWQELKSWDCDPWTAKEALENPLLNKKPQIPGQVEHIQEFDPDRMSVSYHLGGDMDPYLPAFAYIRFFEDTGTPLSLPHLNITGDALKFACDWIAPFIEFWSPALLVRANKFEDLTKKSDFLSRTRVATMDPDLANRVQSWCIQIWDREVENFKRSNRRDRSSLLTCLAEILSRLAVRMNEKQLQNAFERALAIYPFCGHQADSLTSVCDAWFKRLFDAAPREQLIYWLPDLLSAPLSRRDDDKDDDYWSDPMNSFPSNRIERLQLDDQQRVQVEQAIESMLSTSTNEVGPIRNRLLVRLITVYDAEKLAPAYIKALGELLWSKRNENGLPAVNWLRWSSFLFLPHPVGVDVTALVKANILASGPFDGGAIICNANGSVGIAGGPEPTSNFIYEAGLASKPFVEVIGERAGTIEWTDLEVLELYERAIDWWTKAKLGCSSKFSGFGEIDKKALGRQVSRFLTRIVIPRFTIMNSSQKQGLLDWLADMRESQVFVSSALPYVVAQMPEKADEFTNILVEDLGGTKEGAIIAAADALCHYAALRVDGHIAHSEVELVKTLRERISFRRKQCLRECLVSMIRLIAQSPQSIPISELLILVESLKVWADQLSLQAGPYGEFSEAERPIFLYQIGYLSGTLFALSAYLNLSVPNNIAHWKTICSEAQLPDVKRAFEDGAQFFDDQRKQLELDN